MTSTALIGLVSSVKALLNVCLCVCVCVILKVKPLLDP